MEVIITTKASKDGEMKLKLKNFKGDKEWKLEKNKREIIELIEDQIYKLEIVTYNTSDSKYSVLVEEDSKEHKTLFSFISSATMPHHNNDTLEFIVC